MKNIKVRQAKKGDSKRIWEIRNHPLMRQSSNNQEEISFENHDQWFKNKYFRGSDNYCFVLVKDSNAIGYCRFDFNDREENYLISIAIDVNYQGKGLGSLLLKEALEVAEIKEEIIAQTFKENISSKKIFERNSFVLFKEDNKSYYLKYKS